MKILHHLGGSALVVKLMGLSYWGYFGLMAWSLWAHSFTRSDSCLKTSHLNHVGFGFRFGNC